MSTTMTSPYAVPTTIVDTIVATTLADYSKTLTFNVYNSNNVLKYLSRVKKMVDGGASIVKNIVKEEQNSGGFYLGADVLDNTQPDTITSVEFKWQNAYEPISITRDEERSNSGSDHKILDLVTSKVKLSEAAMGKRLEQALSTPVASANNLIDLETLVNTGTLGSLAGGTYTVWQSTVTTSGAFASQGLTDMGTAYYAVSGGADNDNPTVIITNKTVFQKFEQTRLPLERISNGDLTANAGFKNLTFKGTPIIYGNYVGSGLMFGLNENYIELVVDSMTDMVTTDFRVPTNQTVKVAYILWRGNLVTDNRRRNFKLSSIS